MHPKTSIYIVDDDIDDLNLLKVAFENVVSGIRIIKLNNGRDLLQLISHQTMATMPDLILSDTNMPRMNGLDALSLLKSDPATKFIPVILLSTSNDQTLINQAYDYGASAFLVKPTSIKDYNHIAESVSLSFLNEYIQKDKLIGLMQFSNKSILIIEDNHDKWELISQALKNSIPEINLLTLAGNNLALDFLTDIWNTLPSQPQLIILDLYLPNRRDGLNLLDSIHYFFKLHRLAHIPVIIVSDTDFIEDIHESYNHDASAYLIKAQGVNYSISYLQNLCSFWLKTVSLPTKNFLAN